MIVNVEVGIPCAAWRDSVPAAEAMCTRAVRAAVAGAGRLDEAAEVEVSLLLADDGFVRGLNRDYRGRDEATNVLSFPAGDIMAEALTGPLLLGDIVLAHETVCREARARGLALGDHFSHLVVHGALHLLGCDHESDGEAAAMEELETRVLAGLGIGDPYRTGPAVADRAVGA